MIKGLYIMSKKYFNLIYTQENRDQIEKYVDIYAPPMSAEEAVENLEVLKEAEVIFSGWGAPYMDYGFLEASESLKTVFYGSGTVKEFVTPEFWKRGIILTSAYMANGVPVSEFTLAQILFSLKRGWEHMRIINKNGSYLERMHVPGAYESTVGIISLGTIGQNLNRLLKSFSLKVIAFDPFFKEIDAEKLGVKLVTLEELFRTADVVSLHTPWLKETEGMITGDLIKSMKTGATFINTSRGAVVNEEEMIKVLAERVDITALLDVTYPEPPVVGSPLYTMENVFLTPHLAGSMDGECARMGSYMVEELMRYILNEDFKWNITEEMVKTLA
ncbi:MAG: hydroxyacid dehydrogenase [Bacteroidetes bacterium]|nr:hydroxyacid dehydrogenase [Bacteroidota bacterium]